MPNSKLLDASNAVHQSDVPKPPKPLLPLQVGSVLLPNAMGLAPMAGASELAFRLLCQEQGCGLTCTELVSAKSIRYTGGIDRSYRYIELDQELGATAIQLFGAEVEDFVTALEAILADPRTAYVRLIDVNMGCPVQKVVKTGAGSALLRTPDLAAQIIEAIQKRCRPLGVATTAKIRIGFEKDEFSAIPLALKLAEAGLDALCIHGRTRSQMYQGQANWEAIAQVRQALRQAGYALPVFANGDVVDGASAQRILEVTGAEGFMIGRGAMGKPWIFRSVAHYLETGSLLPEPNASERADFALRHCARLIESLGEGSACREFRKTAAWYAFGLPGAAVLRQQASQLSSWEEVLAFFTQLRQFSDQD